MEAVGNELGTHPIGAGWSLLLSNPPAFPTLGKTKSKSAPPLCNLFTTIT